MKKVTTDQFIKRSKKIHNNKYDYSKVKYINNKTKIKIICPKHGEFEQIPHNHLNGHGCSFCSQNIYLGIKGFIKKANRIHNNKYDYSKVKYINNSTEVVIICPEHGNFIQTPNSHLNGHGCKLCGIKSACNKKSMGLGGFINRANMTHDNKYDYSKSIYINRETKIKIICPKHGEFEQIPHNHLSGHGCPACGGAKRSNTKEFIKKANQIHNNKYNYSKVKYVNNRTKVFIICPKHGSFEQNPHDHLSGRGCPQCVGKVSKESQKWLDSLKVPENMREKYLYIGNRYVIVDALDDKKKIVYEYDHPYWHGHPDMDLNKRHPVSKKTYRELLEATENRRKDILKIGYTIIQTYYGNKINIYYPEDNDDC